MKNCDIIVELEVGGEKISAKKVHIAVGAKPAKLAFEGAQHRVISGDMRSMF